MAFIPPVHASLPQMEPSRIHYLESKYFSLWRQAVATRIQERGCPLSQPSLELLKNKIFVTHATDYFPEGGKLTAGCLVTQGKAVEAARCYKSSARQTLHFALGGLVSHHGFNSWKDKKFALIAPLGSVSDRLINVSPYDTFLTGDLPLTQEMTLIMPEGTSAEGLPKGMQTVTYGSHEKLKDIIDRVILMQKGWLIKTCPQVSSLNGSARSALFNQTEVNSPDFFRHLLTAYPFLSYGSHQNSLQGEVWRIGEVDIMLNSIIENFLLFSKGGELARELGKIKLSDEDREFLVIYLSHQRLAIAKFIESLPQEPHFLEPLQVFLNEVRVWQAIFEIDLTLNKHSYFASRLTCVRGDSNIVEEWIMKTMEQLRLTLSKGDEIDADIIARYAESARALLVEAPAASHSGGPRHFDYKKIATLCCQMHEEERESFLKLLKKRKLTYLPMARFYIYVYRWSMFGDKKLEPLIHELRMNPEKYQFFLKEVLNRSRCREEGGFGLTTYVKELKEFYRNELYCSEVCDPGNKEMARRFKDILNFLNDLDSRNHLPGKFF